jgi:hypothetical protein
MALDLHELVPWLLFILTIGHTNYFLHVFHEEQQLVLVVVCNLLDDVVINLC